MFNKKLLATSMAAAISAGMVAQVQAVTVQESNLGQVLLGPIYTTHSDLDTTIIVTNTRTDTAVIAKVVFREYKASSEVLDFFIYLSPGDVFRGTVTGDNNAARIVSTDDSMTDNEGNFSKDIDFPFFTSNETGASANNGSGHFEVIGSASFTAGTYMATKGGAATITVRAGMAKEDLYSLGRMVGTSIGYSGAALYTAANTGTGVASSIDPENMLLTGEVKLTMPSTGGQWANYVMTALGPDGYGDWSTDCASDDGVVVHNGVSGELGSGAGGIAPTGCVINNPNYTTGIKAETLIGLGFGTGTTVIGGATTAGVATADNIIEIEKALVVTNTFNEYDEGDAGDVVDNVVTFPTRYRHNEALTDYSAVAGCNDDGVATTDTHTAPFNTDGSVTYRLWSWDDFEGSAEIKDGQFSGGSEAEKAKFVDEVNVKHLGQYSETTGRSDLEFLASDKIAGAGVGSCGYFGVPALTSTVKYSTNIPLWSNSAVLRDPR